MTDAPSSIVDAERHLMETKIALLSRGARIALEVLRAKPRADLSEWEGFALGVLLVMPLDDMNDPEVDRLVGLIRNTKKQSEPA